MPVTVQQLRDLKPFEFQNWVIQRLNGTHAPRKSADMGIDGYSFFEHHPIQVKQSASPVGRNVVDNFETALARAGRTKGYIVGFDFTRNAREEVARAKGFGVDIELVTVAQLLDEGSGTPGTRSGLFGVETPMPAARPENALPSADELLRSDRAPKRE